MFFFWAFTSMFAYALQDTLLVKHARKVDTLSLAIYRNISFVITLFPLLFLTSPEKIKEAYFFAPQILFSGLFGACAVWLGFLAYRFLPVGIVSSISKSILVIGLTLLSFIVFQETITTLTFFIICVVLAGTAYLGNQNNHMPHLDKKTYLGILFTIFSSFCAIATIFLMIKTSRELDPFVSGYFWEVSIGVFAFLIGIIRYIFTKKKIQIVKISTFIKIALAASPTLIGTGALAFAVTLGPVSITSTIGASSMIVTSILAHFLYKEKLSKHQWIGIIIVTCGIIVLKLTA